jgi:predicted nucleotidyltransferase
MAEPATPADLLPALSSLSQWLKDENVPYAIIGGVAVSLNAQPRLTADIDAIIWLDLDRANDLVKSAQAHGFVPRINNPIEFVRNARVLLLRHEETQIGIDLSCGVLPFEQELLERAIDFRDGAIDIKIATPEDLIILKAVAHRTRDLIDIDNLLNVNEDVNLDRIRYWVRQFADALESPDLVGDLERILNNR